MGANLKNEFFVTYNSDTVLLIGEKKVLRCEGDSPGEYLEISHTGSRSLIEADALLQISNYAGNIRLNPTDRLELTSGGGVCLIFKNNRTSNQSNIGLTTEIGKQLIFSNSDDVANDYDHPLQTDPTLFIHSDTDPDTDNSQWISLAHNQTDGVIDCGAGDIEFANVDYGNMALAGSPSGSGLPSVTEGRFKIVSVYNTSLSKQSLIMLWNKGGTQYWANISAHGTYT